MIIQLQELLRFETWSLYDKVGFAVLAFICLYMLWLYIGLYTKRMMKHTAYKPLKSSTPGISVIIAAKNEAENLKTFLPFILNQKYENFEVVVVNDGSWDKTQDVLDTFELEYPHLKICRTFEDDHKSFFFLVKN